MKKSQKIITILAVSLVIFCVLFFNKAEINHGHGVGNTQTEQNLH